MSLPSATDLFAPARHAPPPQRLHTYGMSPAGTPSIYLNLSSAADLAAAAVVAGGALFSGRLPEMTRGLLLLSCGCLGGFQRAVIRTPTMMRMGMHLQHRTAVLCRVQD